LLVVGVVLDCTMVVAIKMPELVGVVLAGYYTAQ
jgi:hypothetical protein